MRTVLVVGIGMGEPADLTGRAVEALRSADVVLTLDKGGPADLSAARRHLLAAVGGDPGPRVVALPDPPRDRTRPGAAGYEAAVGDWTAARAEVHRRWLEGEVPEGGTAALLAWGDPSLYDSTLRVLDATGMVPSRLAVEVVPGVSSPSVLAAAHRTSLTRVGRPLLITTGRRLAEGGWPPGVDDVVVMLDGASAWRSLDPAGIEVLWGAHLGGPDQVLVAGALAEVADEIERAKAAARDRRGWVMDTYLLRRG